MYLPPVLRRQALRLRDQILRASGSVFFRGEDVECPCCGARFRRFRSFRGPNRICWSCGSLERHRTTALFFNLNPGMLVRGMRVLHVAPEPALAKRLESVPEVDYIGADFGRVFAPLHVDVTSLDFPDGSLDAVVCNHILEHVPDDRLAMREIGRVLKEDGWAMLLVPISDKSVTDEDPAVTSAEARRERFGQRDHVRRYGRDFPARLRGEGLHVEITRVERVVGEAAARRHRLHAPDGSVEPVVIVRRPA